MTDFLKTAGYEVASAPDGMLGVQLCKTLAPKLIILDIGLPGGSGFSVIRTLKLSVTTSQIFIIVMTGHQDEVYKRKARELGVDAYLIKPCNTEDLLKTIHELIGDP